MVWQLSKVEPMVSWYGPLILNPYTAIITPLQTNFKTRGHSFDPFQEGKGPIGKAVGLEVNLFSVSGSSGFGIALVLLHVNKQGLLLWPQVYK